MVKKMMRVLGLVFLLGIFTCSTASARSVKLDSKHFSSFLLDCCKGYDENHDGYLSDKEMMNIKCISEEASDDCSKPIMNISLKGISYLKNIKILKLHYYIINDLDLSKNTKLEEVSVDGSRVKTTLNIKNLRKLKSLSCDNVGKLIMDYKGYKKLEEVDVNLNGLDTIIRNRIFNISKLMINDSKTKKLSLSQFKELKDLDLNLDFCSVDLKNNKKLERVWIFSSVEKLNFSNQRKLKYITLNTSRLKDLKFKNNVKMKEITVKGPIESLDVSDMEKLRYLELKGVKLEELDLSNNIELCNLDLEGPQLDELDLRNNVELGNLRYKGQINSLDLSENNKLKLLEVNAGLNNVVMPNEVNPYIIRFENALFSEFRLNSGNFQRKRNDMFFDSCSNLNDIYFGEKCKLIDVYRSIEDKENDFESKIKPGGIINHKEIAGDSNIVFYVFERQ